MTRPVFIVGSGRSGTAAMARMLDQVENVEARHEYRVPGFPALAQSTADVWVNSDYRLSWRITELAETYPTATFLNVTRDGRKVVSSFFHKMPIEHGHQEPFPGDYPPMSDFERCCVHWRDSNQAILEAFAVLPTRRWMSVKLEEMTTDADVLQSVIEGLNVPYAPWMFDYLQTPRHVIVPVDYSLTPHQRDAFYGIAGEMMERLGYTGPEYAMAYGQHAPVRIGGEDA